MSVVTEYFVAGEKDIETAFAGWRWGTNSVLPPVSEAEVAPVASPDLSRFARVLLRGISPTELVTLRAAVGGAEDLAQHQETLRPMILAPPVPGRTQWVHRLPAALVGSLAALTAEAAIDAVGERWAAAELARIDTLDDEHVRLSRRAHHRARFWQDMLSEMVTLATLAHDKGEGLYLFMHL
jgi:hypothetical protein